MNSRMKGKRRLASLIRATMWTIAGLTILRVWFAASPVLPTAHAQIPDAGKQRLTLVKEVQRTNQLLSDIKAILQTKTLKVRLAGADN